MICIPTAVIVGFIVEIYEEWNDDLEDPNSEAFTDLAEIYLNGFLESLKNIDEVDGTSQIKFANVRVVAFILDEMELINVRQKRSNRRETVNIDKIKAEMETTYDMIAQKNADTGLVEESKPGINAYVKI